ncbi:MAG: YdaU family protein [Alphaproteobacteria bacterium]|nr:YdaU family protein [Alphaproteobacteria bacterium]
MSERPWYKRYASDALNGKIGLELEERGAYDTLLDMMYDRGRPVPDDPRWIAGHCNCSVRKWNSIRQILIDKGKISILNGEIHNARADQELAKTLKTSRKRAENGAKGGNKSGETRRAASKNKDLPEPNTPVRARVPDTRDQKSSLREHAREPEGDFPENAFDEWYRVYPHKVGKIAAIKAFDKIRKQRKATFSELTDGLQRYIDTKPPDRNWCNPATFLNEGRWNDEPAPNTAPATAGRFGPASGSADVFVAGMAKAVSSGNRR